MSTYPRSGGGGALSISVDKTMISAGKVVFKVTDNTITETHEMVLVKLNRADLEPSANDELKVKLAPGNNIHRCNSKGHCEAGVATKITAVAGTASN